MYYSPPKSSIWGHSLRRVKPDVQRERVERFFAEAVAEFRFTSGNVYLHPAPDPVLAPRDFDAHFLGLLKTDRPQFFSNLSEAQFELCFRELLKRPALFDSGRQGACVCALYNITSWSIEGSLLPTNSSLALTYGARPWITTIFHFESLRDFEYLRDSLLRAELCKLNPKHIKGRKS